MTVDDLKKIAPEEISIRGEKYLRGSTYIIEVENGVLGHIEFVSKDGLKTCCYGLNDETTFPLPLGALERLRQRFLDQVDMAIVETKRSPMKNIARALQHSLEVR